MSPVRTIHTRSSTTNVLSEIFRRTTGGLIALFWVNDEVAEPIMSEAGTDEGAFIEIASDRLIDLSLQAA